MAMVCSYVSSSGSYNNKLYSLLYKDEKPSVCLSVLAALITLPYPDVSTPDLLEMKATSSGIYKFVLESF